MSCLRYQILRLKDPLIVPFRGLSQTSPSVVAEGAKLIDHVPSLSKIPYIGSIHHYIPAFGGFDPGKIHELADKRYHQYGPICKEDFRIIKAKGGYAFWLSDANDAEKVYRSGGKYPVRGGFEALTVYRKMRSDIYKSAGLPILNGKDWYNSRSQIQPVLLQPKVILNFGSTISMIADEMINVIRQIRNEETMEIVDFVPELYRFTLESIAYIGLDTRLNCLTDYGESQKNLISAVSEMFCLEAELNDSFIWRFLGKPLGSKWKRFIEINDKFTKMVYHIVSEKMEKMKDKLKDPEEDRSALELFLLRPGCRLEDAVTMVMDMFFAGIDSTAHMIAFNLYYLANHPKVQEKLYHEIASLSNGTGQLNEEQLTKLTLLRASIKETSRLSPVAPLLQRINQEPIVLSGYSIPPQCFLIINHYTMGRRPDYFDDPLSFKPDRWEREGREKINSHPFAVIPFGHGPRMCIGRRIAELEVLILLSKIIFNFKLSTSASELPTSLKLIAYPDNPLPLTFTERKHK